MRNARIAGNLIVDTSTEERDMLIDRRHNSHNERGFTLPELLVAMVLTMIVTGAALTALQDATRANEAVSVMSDVNQNLRVAMNLVIRDLLSTGEGIPTGGISIPSGVGAARIQRPGPVGAAWEFDETWVVLPAVGPGAGIGPLVNDVATDAVTLLFKDHRLDFPSDLYMQSIADDGSGFTVPASLPINDPSLGIHAGDLIMWSNGKGNTLQEVTSVEGQTVYFASTAGSNLNQPNAPDGSVLSLRDVDGAGVVTWQPVSITRIAMITYYLYVPDSGPITSPHMIRRVNYGEERVVAIGVENVQFTWDLVDGVNNPTNIDDPGPTAADPDNLNTEHQIRKANLVMAARSLQTYSRTGEFMRATLATQVSLRSLAFVSRYDLQ